MNACSHSHRRSTFVYLMLVLLIVSLWAGGAALTGCGSSESSGSADGSSGTAGAETASPEEVGMQIVDIYSTAMGEIVDLMEERPDPATLGPQVEQLKDDTIQQLVDRGKEVEAMSAADRAVVENTVLSGVQELQTGLYEAYQEGQAYYAGEDLELGNLIASFNIITQYAFFDLLREQEPEEAERLGL